MNDNVLKYIKRIFNIITILGLLATIIGGIYLWRLGAFQNKAVLQQLIIAHKFMGPLIFFCMQVIQVIVPIIPGGLTMAAGVLIFGPVEGFFYNYIGIVLGSLLLFHFGRKYGQSLVQTFVKEKNYKRYMGWLDKGQKRFNIIFALLILSPIAPDDALVLIASQTKMSWRFLFWTLILCKPLPIFLYSYLLIFGGGFLEHIL
ncbi:TVP38/TMEM64 family protein [Lactococcus nasutitermitis]|uniref:TVP38/TMEM64 family membrane protein n=1 Tax=Lactococcus nasutitermitis TaxID=1652957 RepID=A0ABV9JCG4_9LACT|nr:TVP38/TMEM64 family protein [Lactococcus nasutitermitis]